MEFQTFPMIFFPQGCVVIEDSQVVKLHAPKGSATLKSSERGIGVAVHKFSFTQVCIAAGLNTDSNKITDQTPYMITGK